MGLFIERSQPTLAIIGFSMGFRGIKSRIFLQFWILFFLSMFFIYMLVMFIFLERTTAHYTEQKRKALRIACELMASRPFIGDTPGAFAPPSVFHKNETFLFLRAQVPEMQLRQRRAADQELMDALVLTLRTGQPVTQQTGKTFGLLFVQHAAVIVTVPINEDGRTVAAGGLMSPLTGIYQDFRRIQKIAFAFVLINSLFFALIGNRQLSRVYFKPLQRLAKRAETYTDEDSLFFSVRKEDNEFSVLSSSLNKMLHRISEDKRRLQETIDSLQSTNIKLKKAQEDVIRAEKLASVGRLTSGIAHEIGNPIGIVLGYLDLMKQPDLTREEQNDFIDRSEKEITRINHIIRQLLDMTRTSNDESKPVAVHALLEDLISVFTYQPTAGEIAFESEFGARQDIVYADPDRLRQVFLNMMLNAVDAINTKPPSEPRIRLVTEGPVDMAMNPGSGKRAGIRIRIEDNGPGIRASDVPHVFDPFFTTKQPGKGTGLGLSVSFMIIEKLGGHLTAADSEWGGAAFQVVLPVADGTRSSDEDQPAG